MEATSASAAELRVEQTTGGSTVYVEGSRSFVRIETTGGSTVTEEMLSDAELPALLIELDPGTYRLVSWQRPCDGNCENLDPPRDECDKEFRMAGEEPLLATIRVRPHEGCDIVISMQ